MTRDETITTKIAAEELGISQRRVQHLIEKRKLPAVMYGRDWLIRRGDLDLVRDRRPGRPKGYSPKKS